MLRKIINKISNPLLFYTDHSGHSVFKNYCLYKKNGCLYDKKYTMQEVGKTLEYRFSLDKKLRFAIFFITIILYILFIHQEFSLLSLFAFEIIWILLVFGARLICANYYNKHLVLTFGQYEITDFKPHLKEEKVKEFRNRFKAKVIITLILIILFMVPAFLLSHGMKLSLNSKKPNFKKAIKISKIYNHIYPKSKRIYDMSAYAKYMLEDYLGGAQDYKKIFIMSGKNFENKDFTRFANLLHLEKLYYGSQGAIDDFNDYATRKKTTILNQTKLLWIKSMFSVRNNVSDSVIQDYDDLLTSLDKKDYQNRFYITCDKAYMLYLLGEYESALELYNILIPQAQGLGDKYSKELHRLYAERGFTKRKLGDISGAQNDFSNSNFDIYEINAYEPTEARQGFIIEKF